MEWRLPGVGRGENEELVFNGYGVSPGENQGMKMDGGDGCPTM